MCSHTEQAGRDGEEHERGSRGMWGRNGEINVECGPRIRLELLYNGSVYGDNVH
jgi:hypothetical protein